MKSTRLASMSLEELSALRKEVDAAITRRLVAERARFAGLLKELDGYEATPTVRRGRPPKANGKLFEKTRKKAAIKYRGTKPGEKWSGRGMTPRWMMAYIKQGKKKESFLVK